MSTTPEGRIKRMVVTMLKKYGIWYFFPAANGFGRAGIPDIIAIVNGLFVGIECKADRTKKPTVLQVQCGEKISAAGGKWFLVYDKASLDQVEQLIKEVKENSHGRHPSCEGACAKPAQPCAGAGNDTDRP